MPTTETKVRAPASTLRHLNIFRLVKLSTVLERARKAGADAAEAGWEHLCPGEDSDEMPDSSDSDSDSDSDSSFDSDDSEAAERRRRRTRFSNFRMVKFLILTRSLANLRKAFEKAIVDEINAYDGRVASKIRARQRLECFVDDHNWYTKASRYAVKPGTREFKRPWHGRKQIIVSRALPLTRADGDAEPEEAVATTAYRQEPD